MDNLFESLPPYLLIVAFLVFDAFVVALVFFLVYQTRQSTIRAWDDLAMRTGLTLEKGGFLSSPTLSGEFRGRPLRVYTFSRGSSRNRTSYTGIQITVNNTTGSTLGLSPSTTVGDFFGKMFNAQDVQIGNVEFDSRFTVKSNPPDFATAALDDSMVRMNLMELQGYFDISLQASAVTYTERGTIRDAVKLEKLFNTLSDIADRAEGKKRGAF